jgi:hypothetical protein
MISAGNGNASDDGLSWDPARATREIREIARSERLNLSYRLHAKEQMAERDLIVSDVLHVLKNGFVYAKPEPSTRSGYFRYAMESKTPNSGSRRVRVIVIPDKKGRC